MIDFKPMPFDVTQKLYLLKAGADQRAAVHPEQFREARLSQERRDEPPSPDAQLWEDLAREHLIAGKTSDGRILHRVGLTTDAGLGKSYNLLWMRHAVSGEDSKLAAFVIAIGSLSLKEGFNLDTLMRSFMTAAGYSEGDRPKLAWVLDRLRRRGELILLFDGLDMASEESVQVLGDILSSESEWSACRIVVAGRPFALERHWTKLFTAAHWSFVQIAEFDAKQQRRALGKLPNGKDRYDNIPKEARSILTTPRVLECLCPLQEAELAKLTTVGDVYWQAVTYMLRKALDRTVTTREWDRLLAVLGALAFTMYAQTEKDEETGELSPNLDRIKRGDMTSFSFDVLDNLAKTNLRFTEPLFDECIEELSQLNTLLHHGWFDVNHLGGEDLLWRNASLQEFFAAYWITRWGTSEDAGQLRGWVVDPLTDRNRGFYWFWRYAAEMPAEAVSSGTNKPPQAWVAAMSPLYDWTAVDSVRSTEFIYRSWERMKEWDARPLRDFLAEFPRLAKEGTAGQRRICSEITNGFRLIPAGTCYFGADPRMPEIPKNQLLADETRDVFEIRDDDHPGKPRQVGAFGLHRWPVTNEMYELFDPRHLAYRWDYREKESESTLVESDQGWSIFERWVERKKVNHPLASEDIHGDDRCPVVNVSWYDAKVFATWCGFQLPTDLQWEHAVRAGSAERWFLGIRDVKELRKYAHFDCFSGITSTVPVDDGKRLPNANGIYDMLGNVWEWCENYYYRIYASHLIRGKGWDAGFEVPKSRSRARESTGSGSRAIGFRLASHKDCGLRSDGNIAKKETESE